MASPSKEKAMTTNKAAIERAILRDREQRQQCPANTAMAECLGCRKPYVYRGPRGDNSGRFCCDQCRVEYDIPGAVSFDPFKHTKWNVVAGGDPGYLVATPMTRVSSREREDGVIRGGWRINCPGCGKSFESFGLRYCKPECRRAERERTEAKQLIEEAGISIDKRRPCQRCGKPIPRWRNGKAVRKDAKFCGRC
jgi:hypothetical protein